MENNHQNSLNQSSVKVPGKKSLDWTNILFLTITPAIVVFGLPAYIYFNGVRFSEVILFGFFYWATGLGITMGYHRLFAHKTYEASPLLRFILLIFGAMALQNSAYKWSSDHRLHHQHVDQEPDPYNAKRGFWYSHIGWVFYKEPEDRTYKNVTDLAKDPMVMWQDRHYAKIAFGVGWLLPLLVGFFFGRPFGFFLWAGILRTVFVHHGTFFINSLAHIVGKQTYDDQITARDSWFIALFSFGEGFHNFHHRFQGDYRNGIRWYHWDPSKWLIRLFSFLGLTKNLRKSSEATIWTRKFEMDLKRLKEKVSGHLSREGWQKICQESELSRLKLEKSYEAWKASIRDYAQWKHQSSKWEAKEVRAQMKRKVRQHRESFILALRSWNRSIKNYSNLSVYAVS